MVDGSHLAGMGGAGRKCAIPGHIDETAPNRASRAHVGLAAAATPGSPAVRPVWVTATGWRSVFVGMGDPSALFPDAYRFDPTLSRLRPRLGFHPARGG